MKNVLFISQVDIAKGGDMFHCGALDCPGHSRKSGQCPNPKRWEKYNCMEYGYSGHNRKKELLVESRREKPSFWDFWKYYTPGPDHGESVANYTVDVEQLVDHVVISYRWESGKYILPEISITINHPPQFDRPGEAFCYVISNTLQVFSSN